MPGGPPITAQWACCYVLGPAPVEGTRGVVFRVWVDSVTGERSIKVDAHGVKVMLEAQLPGGDR